MKIFSIISTTYKYQYLLMCLLKERIILFIYRQKLGFIIVYTWPLGEQFTSLDHIWTNWSFDLWFTLVVNNLTETICCFNIYAFTLTFANTPPSFTLSDIQNWEEVFMIQSIWLKKKPQKRELKKASIFVYLKCQSKGRGG